MTGARRASWTVVLVLGGTAFALRAADALPGYLGSVPRGMHVCASLAEAESRTGLHLESIRRGLAPYQVVAGSIRTIAKPAPTIAVSLRRGEGAAPLVTFFRSRSGEIPSAIRPALPAFNEIEISLAPGRAASLRAATMGDGSLWQDLEWSDGEQHTALRWSGRTVELLRLARRIVEVGS